MKSKIVLSVLLGVVSVCCFAAEKELLRFHRLFTDHAVLQQNVEKHPFRGSAPAGSPVEIQFRGNKAVVTADDKGKWCAVLPTGAAGSGFELKAVCGEETIVAKNIAVGEVWFVSGQSNAEFPLSNFKDGAKWAKDADYPQICFQTQTWQYPLNGQNDSWKVLDEKSAIHFSATGFFFAKELHKKQNVPVGVIVSAGSGSVINKWVPQDALA